MEQQTTEARTLIERGDTLLLSSQAREAAAAYAQAVQMDPGAVGGHLGLAEANLALGAYGIVYMACRQVQQLAPESADAALARAILFVLERRYDAALQELDRVIALDPGRAYAHALRGYCLRQLGQTYDAGQAEAKARRLSSGADFASLFPQVETTPLIPGAPSPAAMNGVPQASPRPWDQRSELERQMVRVRFATRNIPIVTYTLIAINVLLYIVGGITTGDIASPGDHLNTSPLYFNGVQAGAFMQHDPIQWYRLVTAMFLHANIAHIGLNMLSLYFVGGATERLFGRWRFTLIYFASGIIAGLTQYFLSPPDLPSLGASGAIFGIFGAFGAFIILRRNLLGRAASAIIGQWIFWLALNLVYGFSVAGIAIQDHIGGVISGFLIGALLIPSFTKIRRSG